MQGHDGWIEDVDIDENSKHIVSCGQVSKLYDCYAKNDANVYISTVLQLSF